MKKMRRFPFVLHEQQARAPPHNATSRLLTVRSLTMYCTVQIAQIRLIVVITNMVFSFTNQNNFTIALQNIVYSTEGIDSYPFILLAYYYEPNIIELNHRIESNRTIISIIIDTSESSREHYNNVTMGYTKKTSSGTPQLGSKGCSLCEDRAIPANLNAHVTDSQTCADIHLQLAMLRYDNAMCATGIDTYRELCCTGPETSAGSIMTALAFMVGALVTGAILKKIISNKKRRMVERVQDNTKEELPGTVSFNSHSSRGKSRGSRLGGRTTAADVEMSSSSLSSSSACYHKMEDPPKTKFESNNNHPQHGSRIIPGNNRALSRSKSRTRDIMQQPTHSRDNNRNARDQNHSRSKSRTRDIVSQPNHSKNNRPVSRSKSRTRDKMQQRNHSGDNNRNVRDQSRIRHASRSRPRDNRDSARPVSRTRDRSRPRDIISQHHSRDSRPQSRPASRSRPTRDDRSRSAGRGRSLSRGRTRDGGGGRSRSQSRSRIIRPPLQHEVEIFGSDDDGLMLPTQLV